MAQEDGSKGPQRILVTGASGLLGLNLALEASREHTIFGQVNNHRLELAASSFVDRFTVIQSDLLVPGAAQRLVEQVQPDWIIHCAALANLDACEADPAQAAQLNTEVPRTLARIVASCGARLLHVSTDAVFNGKTGNYCETDLPDPVGIYSRTKLNGEIAVLEANGDAIVARVNLFGYSLGGSRSLGEFFLNNLQAGRPVHGFTDVIFCPLLANDLANIFLRMLTLELSGLYHVVSSECLSKYDFGVRLARRFGLDENLIQPTSVHQAGLKALRAPNLSLCTDRLTQALGEPPPDVAAGLEKFYQLYQQGYPVKIRALDGSTTA
jgi:dTDP-4-dehydrorhamnose reductase